MTRGTIIFDSHRARRSIDFGWRFLSAMYGYATDIHPRSSTQFAFQQRIAGFDKTGLYKDWMFARSVDEKSAATRSLYGIKFSDIRYPWLSGISGANTDRVYGSAAWQFSKNMDRLYR